MINLATYIDSKGKETIYQPLVRMVNRDTIRLEEDYSFEMKGKIITIPKGFEYDGASVPRALWSITGICPFGWVLPAALIHDFTYVNEGNLGQGIIITREESDKFFVNSIYKDLKLINKNFISLYKFILRKFGTPKYGKSSWNQVY